MLVIYTLGLSDMIGHSGEQGSKSLATDPTTNTVQSELMVHCFKYLNLLSGSSKAINIFQMIDYVKEWGETLSI